MATISSGERRWARISSLRHGVPVEAQVQQGIETEVILGALPAEASDLRQFMHIGPQGHGLQAHLHSLLAAAGPGPAGRRQKTRAGGSPSHRSPG